MHKYQPFPGSTKGVFYFHHVPGDNIQSQTRFRLCESLDGFQQGTICAFLTAPTGDFLEVYGKGA